MSNSAAGRLRSEATQYVKSPGDESRCASSAAVLVAMSFSVEDLGSEFPSEGPES